MAKKKPMNFFTLVADAFKEQLAEAGYRTIVRSFRENSMNIHIQGQRKKHVISIIKTQYRKSDPISYIIQLQSDRLRTTYTIWENQNVIIEDPKFAIDVDAMAKKVVDFMGHITKVNEHLVGAHEIFGKPKYGGGFDPKKKRVSRTGV
ncbi:MAG: hypothetical protein ACW99J_18370 [Candidatus Thorarchaeota archaeon]|jgi:predicted transcriptional regulator